VLKLVAGVDVHRRAGLHPRVVDLPVRQPQEAVAAAVDGHACLKPALLEVRNDVVHQIGLWEERQASPIGHVDFGVGPRHVRVPTESAEGRRKERERLLIRGPQAQHRDEVRVLGLCDLDFVDRPVDSRDVKRAVRVSANVLVDRIVDPLAEPGQRHQSAVREVILGTEVKIHGSVGGRIRILFLVLRFVLLNGISW